jgi:trehalose-phosphatase
MGDRERILGWLGEWLAGGGRLLLMCDYDGTLSPIVRDPGDAWLPPDVRAHLRMLAGRPEMRVAILSGRDLVDLRARCGVADAIYAGCHGLEIDGPDIAFSHPEAEAQQDSLRIVSFALNQRARSVAGMRVEAKRLGVAVHYRDVAPDQVRQVEMELARAIQRSARPLKIFHGAKVIEILPHVGWNKGQCALRIRETVERGDPRPLMSLYIGDDWTDEQAFEALAGQAMTVRVGQEVASRADYRLDSVESVHDLVAGLAGLPGARGAA